MEQKESNEIDVNILNECTKEIKDDEDLFKTSSKARTISKFLNENKENSILDNNIIAIYGEWGSGKSCLMKTIEQKLDKNLYETLWFETWKYEHDSNLSYSLLKYVLEKNKSNWDNILEKGKLIGKNVFGLLKSFSSGLEIDIPYYGISVNAGDMIGKLDEEYSKRKDTIEKNKCLYEKIEEFEEEFMKIKLKDDKKLIVFLDDLDRCDSDNIINLISSLKLVLSCNKNIIFIIGIDRRAVTLALKNKYANDMNKAEEYLEKIFPINFSISDYIYGKNFNEYVEKIFNVNSDNASTIINFLETINFTNPRKIKKVFRKFFYAEDFLISSNIDISCMYNIIFVIYVIILNIFYNDEYKKLLAPENSAVNNIRIQYHSKETALYKSMMSYTSLECMKDIGTKSYNVYKFLELFSTSNLKKDSIIRGTQYSDGRCRVSDMYGWFNNLEGNSICKNFMIFMLEDKEFLEKYRDGEGFNKDLMQSYIMKIDEIL